MTIAEMKQRQQQMQRSSRLSSIAAAQKIISKGETVWIPPRAKDRHGNEIDDDDVTFVREERGQAQSMKHSAVLGSMDLMVDGAGFLIPRKCKKAVDDCTVDNEICLYSDEESESDSTSSDNQSSSEEEDADRNEASLSSIPYCRLVPDSFDMGVAPQTPSAHKSRRSMGTLETEAMTRTTSDSQSDFFASPRPAETSHSRGSSYYQTPRQEIPQSCDVPIGLNNFVSPLPDPSPSSGNQKSKRRISLNKTTSKRASALSASSPSTKKAEASKRDSFYIPGITAPSCSSSKVSKDSRDSVVPKEATPMQKRPVLASPVISTSRISPAGVKKIGHQTPVSTYRSPGQHSRNSIQRNRSESAADHHKSPKRHSSLVRGVSRVQSDSAKQHEGYQPNYDGSRRNRSKHGGDRHFVPGDTNEVCLIASPNVILRRSSEQPTSSFKSSPTKTPSSRSTRSTSITSRMTFSNSTGRETLETFPSFELDAMENIQQMSPGDSERRHRRVEAPDSARKSTTSCDLGAHFVQQELNASPHSPSRRSQRRSHRNDRMINHIQALTLDDDGDDDDEDDDCSIEVSEAGAVIIPTRKIVKTPSSKSLRRKSSQRSSSQHRSRRESSHHQ